MGRGCFGRGCCLVGIILLPLRILFIPFRILAGAGRRGFRTRRNWRRFRRMFR